MQTDSLGSADAQTPDPRRWFLLATVGVGIFLITLDNTVLYTALPTIVDQLHASSSQMLWIINAYPVVICGLLLGAGTLGDKVGHRRMFIIGLIIFGVASLLGGFAPNVYVLIGARATLAIGAAVMMPATLALISHTFEDPDEMNLAIGIWASLSTVAAALGPLVGGLLLEYFRWGSVFFMNVPIVIIGLAVLPFVSKPDTPHPEQTWDLRSSIQAMITLVAVVLVIKELAHRPQNWLIIGIAAVLMVVFGYRFSRRQKTLTQPLLTFDLFRIPAFLAGVLGASLSLFAVVGFQFLTTQRLQLIDGFSPLHTGAYVTVVAIGSMLTSIVAGKYLNRVGLRTLIAGGLGVGAVGSAIVVLGSMWSSNPWLLIGLFIMGLGLGGTMAVASIAMIGNAPPHRAGMASSVEEVSYELGSLVSVAVLGSAVTFFYSLIYDANRPNLPGVDGESANQTRKSLQDALQLAEQIDDAGLTHQVVETASQAYESSYSWTAAIVATVLAVGSAYTFYLLRDRATTAQVTPLETKTGTE